MSQGITRDRLRALSTSKLEDARLLFQNSRWASAYYLAGYSVELGLKACAAKLFSAEAIPDKKLVISLHTHDLNALIGLAGLKGDLKARQDQDGNFAASWGITSEWTPEARYEATDKSSAHFLVNAIAHPEYGVLSWIRTYW